MHPQRPGVHGIPLFSPADAVLLASMRPVRDAYKVDLGTALWRVTCFLIRSMQVAQPWLGRDARRQIR